METLGQRFSLGPLYGGLLLGHLGLGIPVRQPQLPHPAQPRAGPCSEGTESFLFRVFIVGERQKVSLPMSHARLSLEHPGLTQGRRDSSTLPPPPLTLPILH